MTVAQVSAPVEPSSRSDGVGVEVEDLRVQAGRAVLVDGVSLRSRAGELLAVAGPSGAGKSTLLEAMAGLRDAAAGSVRYVPSGGVAARPVVTIGFVPQDDIIHRELPLRASLRHAARLRLPDGWSSQRIDRRVDAVLSRLGLDAAADVRVASLSGGQRKRASIATELLADPDVLFLDEPTSGLDPATAAEVIGSLRELAGRGTTVVFTTHGLADLERADRIAFVVRGGRLGFHGTLDEARRLVGPDLAALYEIDAMPTSRGPRPAAAAIQQRPSRPKSTSALRQWRVLTRRTLELLTGNRLTTLIMFGSPALVVAMMVVLFPAGAAADLGNHPTTALQTMFWISFAAFFFGLTAGLLQIVPEAAIARRERMAGVRPSVYVASKVTALAPVLVVVTIGMLVVLHRMGRLPTTEGSSPASLVSIVLLESLSALALGLLASALVRDAAQATLALPMLCFPQVLFAGAVIGVVDMAAAGRFVSNGMATRWGFEGIGRSLAIGSSVDFGGELSAFRPAMTGSEGDTALVLVGITLVLLAATVLAVGRRTR